MKQEVDSKEFELKYIKLPNITLEYSKIIGLLNSNGYNKKRESDISNIDYYYDTEWLDFFKTGKSMRIRTAQSDKIEHWVTYKSPTGEEDKFSIRNEQNELLVKLDIQEAKKILHVKGINVENILPFPILKVINKRHVIEFEKDGVLIEFDFDEVNYDNLINGRLDCSQMIEVESKSSNDENNRIILMDVYNIFENYLQELALDKNPNKYYTGLVMTDITIDAKERKDSLQKVIN